MAIEDLAATAWSQLQLTRIGAERIQVLKKGSRSTVYRLEGAGPGGVPVIAKRSRRAQALIERVLYEQVLRALPMASLAYYGFVDEPIGELAWLFIGCADGQPYSAAIREHTELGARWPSAREPSTRSASSASTGRDTAANAPGSSEPSPSRKSSTAPGSAASAPARQAAP